MSLKKYAGGMVLTALILTGSAVTAGYAESAEDAWARANAKIEHIYDSDAEEVFHVTNRGQQNLLLTGSDGTAEVVFCIQEDRPFRDDESSDAAYSREYPATPGEVREAVLGSGSTGLLRKNFFERLRNVLANGYPAAKTPDGLTDDTFRIVTQCAVWHALYREETSVEDMLGEIGLDPEEPDAIFGEDGEVRPGVRAAYEALITAGSVDAGAALAVYVNGQGLQNVIRLVLPKTPETPPDLPPRTPPDLPPKTPPDLPPYVPFGHSGHSGGHSGHGGSHVSLQPAVMAAEAATPAAADMPETPAEIQGRTERTSPATGDDSQAAVWGFLALLSGAALAGIFYLKYEHNQFFS